MFPQPWARQATKSPSHGATKAAGKLLPEEPAHRVLQGVFFEDPVDPRHPPAVLGVPQILKRLKTFGPMDPQRLGEAKCAVSTRSKSHALMSPTHWRTSSGARLSANARRIGARSSRP